MTDAPALHFADTDPADTRPCVAVTAERRADELTTLLERRGARVWQVPALHILPLADDADLRARTAALVADPPDLVVVSTGVGFRGWLDAARGWGTDDEFLAALARTRIVTRGPKATGAVRGAGLREEWSPASESSEGVLEGLEGSGLASSGLVGLRIAVQVHGSMTRWEPTLDLPAALAERGADVTPIQVYRWVPPADQGPMRALVRAIVDRQVSAVTFTSAPAPASLLQTAQDAGLLDAMLDALRTDVVAACVGPVTAGPLTHLDIPTVQPERARLSALAKVALPRS
ncbi:uroporphyrinogen-III synthase [Rhodococcus rhodnii]|uniref:Uroporphyrinogen-III synthase n=1 Tax=Rhodococcus rhodnii TaxID=38312 RepID=A0A6P2CJ56_9NOCA|nr:uroporphyrinogen-III synthase [Rhodococcus rhodnii]TXG92857.1 uroporphyrinogen-III synthase [Rhodococcus rhodnii]